jgi:allophanate hydrolase subunit 2
LIRTRSILGTVSEIRSRPGLRRFGVPPGGPWDVDSYLGLQEFGCDPIWEAATTAFGGLPFLSFEATEAGTLTLLGISGAARKNGQSVRLPCRLSVKSGDEIEVTAGPTGMRLLIGASPSGGRDTQVTSPPETNDVVSFVPIGNVGPMTAVVSSEQDRVGIRLSGDFDPPPALARSEPSALGAIQLVNGGLLIHGPDGPTTGGYPKAGVVAFASLSTVAQARPGERLRFEPISLEEALKAREARIRLISYWSSRVRLGLSVE